MSEIEDLEKHLVDLTLRRDTEIKKTCIEKAIKAGKDKKTAFEQCTERHEKMSEIEKLEKHLADLKRQRRDLESSGEQIECPECNIKKTEDEDCPECRIITGITMYLNICKEYLDSEKNCMELYEKVISKEITPDEFFDIIKEKAKDDPEKLDILEYTDELMDSDDVGTEGNPGKEGKKELVMRKPRPSPSISATSVDVGTVMTGGDGNLWVVKAYKRGDKTIQHWVRYDGGTTPKKEVTRYKSRRQREEEYMDQWRSASVKELERGLKDPNLSDEHKEQFNRLLSVKKEEARMARKLGDSLTSDVFYKTFYRKGETPTKIKFTRNRKTGYWRYQFPERDYEKPGSPPIPGKYEREKHPTLQINRYSVVKRFKDSHHFREAPPEKTKESVKTKKPVKPKEKVKKPLKTTPESILIEMSKELRKKEQIQKPPKGWVEPKVVMEGPNKFYKTYYRDDGTPVKIKFTRKHEGDVWTFTQPAYSKDKRDYASPKKWGTSREAFDYVDKDDAISWLEYWPEKGYLTRYPRGIEEPEKPVKPVVEPKKEVKREPVSPKPRARPLKRNRRDFTRDGISVVEHTWLYGDTERGYSIKSGGSKPRYEPEAYIWDNGFVVHQMEYQIEEEARLYAYRDLKQRGWDLEPASEEQVDVEEEDIEVKVKPETFHKTFYTLHGDPVKFKFFKETKYDTWKVSTMSLLDPSGERAEIYDTKQTDKDKAQKYVADPHKFGFYEKPPKKPDYKRRRIILEIVYDVQKVAPDHNATVGAIVKGAEKKGFDRDETKGILAILKRHGQIYEPMHGRYRITEY